MSNIFSPIFVQNPCFIRDSPWPKNRRSGCDVRASCKDAISITAGVNRRPRRRKKSVVALVAQKPQRGATRRDCHAPLGRQAGSGAANPRIRVVALVATRGL